MSSRSTPPKRRRVRRSRLQGRRRRNDREGVTVVEFAIVANLLFLTIFTCIEFARINMVRNLAQDAAYYAARAVMVPGATKQEAENEVQRILGSLVSSGYTVNVNNFDNDSSEIQVSVAVDVNAVALLTPIFFRNKTITSTAILKTERYAGFYRQ